jgi:hypothetical protein
MTEVSELRRNAASSLCVAKMGDENEMTLDVGLWRHANVNHIKKCSCGGLNIEAIITGVAAKYIRPVVGNSQNWRTDCKYNA